MTAMNYVFIAIAILAMMVGLYLILQWFVNRNNNDTELPRVAYDKNGIPIIPRHERDLFDEDDLDDALSGETTITPDRSHLKPVMEGSDNEQYADDLYANDEASVINLARHEDEAYQREGYQESNYYQPSQQKSQQESHQESRANYLQASDDQLGGYQSDNDSLFEDDRETSEQYDDTQSMRANSHHDKEEDLFSTLASATENIMPVIETADEPEFNENSPLLDQHLLSQADYDQNSPLNHAEENINITLVPKHTFQTISGKTILALVEQYGLRYGAMNMFHRYENKDGTGILWFSMMGMTKDGITPFDLNVLPKSEYKGLVLFLSLPHPKALQGFDSMMSIVGLISKQLDTYVLDENNEPLTRERKQQLRTQVQEYHYAN